MKNKKVILIVVVIVIFIVLVLISAFCVNIIFKQNKRLESLESSLYKKDDIIKELRQEVDKSNNSIPKIHPIDKAEIDCISKTGNTYEINRCSQTAQQSWEKDIQETTDELKKILSPEDYKKLQISQTIWENSKNKDYELIDAVISYKLGTMYLNIREGWRTEILKRRALILKEYLNTLREEF